MNAKGDQDYSLTSRLLHRLALGNRMIAEMAFDFELASCKPQTDRIKELPHVLVTGLARAGTTILMREIHRTGEFRSLTYRDMPFVLAPNLWARFSRGSRQSAQARERAHGDGLLVGYDSPEALEEVFWRIFAGRQYIRPDRLEPMRADPDLVEQFRQYIGCIVSGREGQRYLSKNNNNVLRLGSLGKAFPQARVLIPFRDPLAQSRSLHRQHLRFIEAHRGDPFSRQYMTWLVHHEFGADHRPFRFPGQPELPGDHGQPDYWLQNWINTYRHLDANAPANCLWVSYEQLCARPEAVLARIGQAATIRIDPAGASEIRPAAPAPDPDGISPELLESARSLYQNLLDRAI